jgi:hypothetical protein
MLGCLLRICAFAGIYLAAPVAIAAFLIFVVLDDNMSTHYATSTEARGDGAFARGWLPRAMPDSAYDINEEHNLDTNVGHGTFRSAAADADTFRARLQPATAADILRVDGAEFLSQGYSFHAFEDFILAVNWETQEAQFWLGNSEENCVGENVGLFPLFISFPDKSASIERMPVSDSVHFAPYL